MTSFPRDELEIMGDDRIARSLEPLSWPTIRDRIEHMDLCALGGVSLDATLIASLVVRLVKTTEQRDGLRQEILADFAKHDGDTPW